MSRHGLLAVVGLGILTAATHAGEKTVVTGPIDPVPVCTVPFTGSVSVGYETNYIFRGVEYGRHAPWGSVDINYAISDTLSIDAGAWYINPTQDPGWADELDVYAFLNFPLGPFDAFIGATWYYFPEEMAEVKAAGLSSKTDIFELNLGLSYSVGELLDLGVMAAYDENTDGWYFEATASKTIPLTDCLGLGLAAGIAYSADYYEGNGWDHAFATAGLSYALTDNATLNVYVGGNFLLEALEGYGYDDSIHGGTSLTVSF